METAGATLLSALAFTAGAPNASGADYLNPHQNPTNRLARSYVRDIGGRILSIARRGEGDQGASSIDSSGAVTVEAVISTGHSAVSGSNGKYELEAFADQVGSNGLDRSDINSVRVAEGSSPADGRVPLFALRLFTPHPHSHAPNEGDGRFWYYSEGSAVEDTSGYRVYFNGTVHPTNYMPNFVLDRSEVSATGRLMDQIITAALEDRPTQLEEPPFGPLQPLN